jgi:GDSL-like Lipase/Acylhydrolase family
MTRTDASIPTLLATAVLLAWGLLPDELASARSLRWREVLRNDLPNRADYDRIEHGYYEQILDSGRSLGAIHPEEKASDRGIGEDERLIDRVDDVREFVLKPNLVRDPSLRVSWSTNSHGMRDREYAANKPANTFRIALAGDSIAAGWRVEDHECFETLLERAFDLRSHNVGGLAVEVLNFAVPGHGPGQRWSHFSIEGWAFQPDLVIYEATAADLGWDERRLRNMLARGVGFDTRIYREVLAARGVPRGLSVEGYRAVLKPYRREVLEGVYRSAVNECRAKGVPILWVLIPRVGKPIDPEERVKLVETARSAGFDAIIDVADAYGAGNPHSLAVSPHDFHPNAEGHARIARALEAALVEQPELNRLWSGTNPGATPESPGASPR